MPVQIHSANTLHNLLDYDARKFTSAETQLKNILPSWINLAGSVQLKTVFQQYLDLVNQHLQKLESFIEEEKNEHTGFTNRVIQAFIEEAKEKIKNTVVTEAIDHCLLESVLTINRFKISAYTTASAFANVLAMDKPAAFFREVAEREKEIEQQLLQLSSTTPANPTILTG